MAKTENILLDARHWLGWLISTSIIIIIFHYHGVHLHLVWYHPWVLLLTIVVVDYAKHKLELQ